jgi:hypothetical protein
VSSRPKSTKSSPSPGTATSSRQSAQQRLAQQHAANAIAREKAAARRRMRNMLAPVVVVILVIAGLVTFKLVSGAGSPKSGVKASAAASDVITRVTNVPVATLNAVGIGTATGFPIPITAPALTQDGLPRVLYVGAEYCPYCATERWAMVVALSRFGTFTNLGQTASSPSDVYPSTATLTFHGSTFKSTTIAFTGVEQQSNQVVDGSYAPLDTLSAADAAIVKTYDAAPYLSSAQAGAIPFIDIGGKYLISGASYDPQVLQGMTQAQIAAALSDPTSAIAKGADGTANLLTAAICKITSNAPSAVCQASGVQTAMAKLTSTT